MHSKEKLLSNSAVSKTTIELFKELPVSEQECVVRAFIRYIYKADRHNTYVDVEDDYNKITGEFRSYFKEFRLWVGSYMLAKENSSQLPQHKGSWRRLFQRTVIIEKRSITKASLFK